MRPDRSTSRGGTVTRCDSAVLRDAWSGLLSRYPWDCFATLTFARPRRDPFELRKVFDLWLYRWNEKTAIERGLVKVTENRRQDAYGRELAPRVKRSGPWVRDWRRGRRPVYVLGIEPHASGNLHLHAIIRHPSTLPDLSRVLGWSLWHDRENGGFGLGMARIEPPKDQDDVRGYVAKYVTKGGELVLSDSFDAAAGLCLPADPRPRFNAALALGGAAGDCSRDVAVAQLGAGMQLACR